MRPDPGPLALLQSAFPWRTVRWDGPRQLWRVYDEEDPGELLFAWNGPPDPHTGNPYTQAELEALARTGDARVRRGYLAFDYPWVRQRLADWWWFRLLGPKANSDRIIAQNKAVADAKQSSVAREMAAGMKDIKRWWPVLASIDHEKHTWDGADVRDKLFPVGVDLNQKAG